VKGARFLALAGAAITLAVLAGCGGEGAEPPVSSNYEYEGISAGYGFPTDESVLTGYVDSNDIRAIRRHAWNLWAGLNAPSHFRWHGRVLPVWETWYSATEVYVDGPDAATDRSFHHPFQVPRQSKHLSKAFGQKSAAVLSFVRYDRPAAEHVWDQNYYLRKTLNDLRKRFDRERFPVAQRTIEPFPPQAVALKVVFWLIKKNGPTALPYWDPRYPPPPGGQTPTHLTWRRCAAVDASGRLPVGKLETVICNGRRQQAPVVHLDRFYHYRLSDRTDVMDARDFLLEFSQPKEEEQFVANRGQRHPEIGDYAALMAMHVTTKEMDTWTWQTFWWSPRPDEGPDAADRTPSVKGVFRNYHMCTAYSMVTPRRADGGPAVCFDPFLETDLGPTKPFTFNGKTYPADPMAGTESNCMSCHARAATPALQSGPVPSANYGRISNQGYLSPTSDYYKGLLRTDFLWSVVFHSRAEKQNKK